MLEALRRHRLALVAIQLFALGAILFFLGWAFRDAWQEAKPLLRAADLGDLAISILILAAYYLLFTARVAEDARRLGPADPVPRRAPGGDGVDPREVRAGHGLDPGRARRRTAPRTGSATRGSCSARWSWRRGSPALAGIIVFLVSLTTVGFGDAPVLPLLALALILAVGLHPRVFGPVFRRLLRPFGGSDVPPLPYLTQVGLLGFYCCTWLVGGTAIFFLMRSLGDDPCALRTSRTSAAWPRSRRSSRSSR